MSGRLKTNANKLSKQEAIMNANNAEKKLRLKKVTISTLNRAEMQIVVGGSYSCLDPRTHDCRGIQTGGSCLPTMICTPDF